MTRVVTPLCVVDSPTLAHRLHEFNDRYPLFVARNYPFHNVVSAVVGALFAGNGVVVKVSEWSSYSAEAIEQTLRELVARRGFNPGK